MRLQEWLTRHRMSPANLAEKICVAERTVWRYLEGSRTPRPDVIQAIFAATGGSVTANDFHKQEAAHGKALHRRPR